MNAKKLSNYCLIAEPISRRQARLEGWRCTILCEQGKGTPLGGADLVAASEESGPPLQRRPTTIPPITAATTEEGPPLEAGPDHGPAQPPDLSVVNSVATPIENSRYHKGLNFICCQLLASLVSSSASTRLYFSFSSFVLQLQLCLHFSFQLRLFAASAFSSTCLLFSFRFSYPHLSSFLRYQ